MGTSNDAMTKPCEGSGAGSAQREAISRVAGLAMPRAKKMCAGWPNTRRQPRTRPSRKFLTPGQVSAAESAESREPKPTMPVCWAPLAATRATTSAAVIAPGTAGIGGAIPALFLRLPIRL